MHLPNSGRIVLIDDKAEEVEPLIRALGREPVPYIHYDGRRENLPKKPLGGVRYVFLDIELEGMEGQNEKTKASGITSILKKIISDSNGPYVIIFWTKHEEIIKAVVENCLSSGIPPVEHISMEKAKWVNGDGDGDGDNIQELSEALQKKLEPIGAFLLYIQWENILNDSCKQFIKDFASHVDPGEDWSRNTSYLFYELYKAFVAKHELEQQTEQFKCACHLMNRSFQDTLSEKTSAGLLLPRGFRLMKGNVTDETKAKLNTSLFTGRSLTSKPMSGNVYLFSDKNLLTSLKKFMFKEKLAPDDIELCTVIVTPECDIAQNKTIGIFVTEKELKPSHRVIFGLFYEISGEMKNEKKKLHDRGKDGRFIIGPLWWDNKKHLLVIHTGTLSFLTEKDFSEEPLFKLKRDLLFDLQSKTANHINRLGNYQIS